MHLAARWSSRVSQHLAQVVVTNLGGGVSALCDITACFSAHFLKSRTSK